jgi:adenosylcobinamide kinase/adenosylcobinamide-phosphate guanylyltransferase
MRRAVLLVVAADQKEKPVAVVLVGGGARSGKSRFALERARREGSRLVFLATAEAGDEEMARRIEKHRAHRGPDFMTVEAPIELAAAIRAADANAIVVDCLTLWLANVLDRDIGAATRDLEDAARSSPACVILVTNEVGCGIVPDNALAREFRDCAGVLNQRMAEAAAEVYWMVFGQPLRIK